MNFDSIKLNVLYKQGDYSSGFSYFIARQKDDCCHGIYLWAIYNSAEVVFEIASKFISKDDDPVTFKVIYETDDNDKHKIIRTIFTYKVKAH